MCLEKHLFGTWWEKEDRGSKTQDFSKQLIDDILSMSGQKLLLNQKLSQGQELRAAAFLGCLERILQIQTSFLLIYLQSAHLRQDTGPGFHYLESGSAYGLQANGKKQHKNK